MEVNKSDDGFTLYGVYNRPTLLLDADNPMREVCDDNVVKLFEQVLDTEQPDIVNFHNFVGLSFELATIVKRRGIVSTFTTHNYHLLDPKLYLFNNDLATWKNTDFFANSDLLARYPMLKEQYQKRIDKARSILLDDIDYVFAVSTRVRDILMDFSKDLEKAKRKICVINQIHRSTEQFIERPIVNHSLHSPISFAFIGDGMPHKGVHIIAQALALMSNSLKYKNSKQTTLPFVIDFYGDIAPEYLQAIKSMDKCNTIVWHGKYNQNDLRRIADNSDMLLFASVCEDCAPLVLAEGLAMNLPVIAAKIGGVEDFIVDGDNGQLFTAGNPQALASIFEALLNNPFKIEEMRKHCQLPYSFSEYVSHLEMVYSRLYAGDRPDAAEFTLSFRKNLLEMGDRIV
jgi:glycosyltransferase involved in cell wall biosynthesis